MKSPRITNGAIGTPGQYNSLHDDAMGASSLLAHQQLGAFSFGANPSDNQVLTFVINGTTVDLTGRTGAISNPGEFKIQATLALTLQVIMNFLQNPWTTNATQIALASPSWLLLSYVGQALSGTTITAYSLNTTMSAPLTSFNGTTTITSCTYAAQTMELYVEPGVFYINGTQVKFAGGSTPLVTAPVSNPRIDLLTIDNTGTLAWTTGSEGASPAVPSYPTYTKIVICELYNVVGETKLFDLANQTTGQGYIQADVRSFPSIITDFTAISQDFLPDATDTRSLGSLAKEFLNIYSQNIYSNGAAVAFRKFGGSGVDGALSITSGTTTLSFASADVLVKNYTSVSITGTGALGFSNPGTNGSIAIIKTTGNATITSSATRAIDLRSMGASASAYGVGLLHGPSASLGTLTVSVPGPSTNTTSSVPAPGVHIGATSPFSGMNVFAGAGGAAAQTNTGATPGAGGIGGGGLYIECLGALNFTGTVDVSGDNGTNGSGSGTSGLVIGGTGGGSNTDGSVGSYNFFGGPGANGGGGGGGGAGSCVMLCTTLTASSGTITVTGGTGGTGSRTGGTGGTGYSLVVVNSDIV